MEGAGKWQCEAVDGKWLGSGWEVVGEFWGLGVKMGAKKNPAGAGSGGRRGFEGVRSGEMIKYAACSRSILVFWGAEFAESFEQVGFDDFESAYGFIDGHGPVAGECGFDFFFEERRFGFVGWSRFTRCHRDVRV